MRFRAGVPDEVNLQFFSSAKCSFTRGPDAKEYVTELALESSKGCRPPNRAMVVITRAKSFV